MLALKDTNLFKHNPETLEAVRKEFDLHHPGRMDESIDRLDEWIKTQPHFNKKNFSRVYLEAFIINAKGSVEKAKVYIEKLCAYKTFGPQYFSYSTRPVDMPGFENMNICFLPKLTKDNHRIYFVKNCTQKEYTHKLALDYFVKMHFYLEYGLKHNYSLGIRAILDYRKTELSYLLTLLKYAEIRHGCYPAFKGYATRVISVHIITTSKIAGLLVSTIGQIISPKMLGRVYVHANLEDVYKHVEKDLLPSDYGGKEKSSKELSDEWDSTLSTDEFMAYAKDMFQATLNPSLKPMNNFNDLFVGISGTFRTLAID